MRIWWHIVLEELFSSLHVVGWPEEEPHRWSVRMVTNDHFSLSPLLVHIPLSGRLRWPLFAYVILRCCGSCRALRLVIIIIGLLWKLEHSSTFSSSKRPLSTIIVLERTRREGGMYSDASTPPPSLLIQLFPLNIHVCWYIITSLKHVLWWTYIIMNYVGKFGI